MDAKVVFVGEMRCSFMSCLEEQFRPALPSARKLSQIKIWRFYFAFAFVMERQKHFPGFSFVFAFVMIMLSTHKPQQQATLTNKNKISEMLFRFRFRNSTGRTSLVTRPKYPPYRETGVAVPLSHCVSCGIADYRCYTPTCFCKNGLSRPKADLTRRVSQEGVASEAYRAIGGVARNSIANRAIVGH